MEPQIIERFLQSVGQKADVDLYLKLFRAQRRESFAIIAVEARVIRAALDSLQFDLRILAGLGLRPVVLLGLFDPRDADDHAARVNAGLQADGVPARVISVTGPTDETLQLQSILGAIVDQQAIPVLSLQQAPGKTVGSRFKVLETLAAALGTRKVVFLTPGAGLQRYGSARLSVVNLESDYETLVKSPVLSRRRQQLLRRVRVLLRSVSHQMGINIVNPLHLLRELFTVGGAGTFIRAGSRVDRHDDLQAVDTSRLVALIESAFGRALQPGGLDKAWERVYLEEDYRGAALLTKTPHGIYLSKFAVDRQAQGEGIGADLWARMSADYPRFYWRARPDNPIAPWYMRKCQGMTSVGPWQIYWCGFEPEQLPGAIKYAAELPADLVSGPRKH